MLHSCKCLQLNMRKWKGNVKESPSFYIAFLIKPWWKHSLLYKFFFATFLWPQKHYPFLIEHCTYAAWNNSVIVPTTPYAKEPPVGVTWYFYLGRIEASLYILCHPRERRKHHGTRFQDCHWNWGLDHTQQCSGAIPSSVQRAHSR